MCNIKVKICPYDISDYAVSHNFCSFALPFLFFLLHISYGIGTVCGLAAKKPAKETRNI